MKALIYKILSICLVSLIPIIGILVGSTVSHGYEQQYENTLIQVIKESKGIDVKGNIQFLKEINLNKVCKNLDTDPVFSDICRDFKSINYLKTASIMTLTFTFLIYILIYILGMLSRKNRNILFYLFRPGLFISQISAALLVISNSIIIIFSIYFAESFYYGKIHVVLLGALGLTAGYAALRVLIKSFSPIKAIKTQVYGKILSKENYPKIWNFVELLTKKVGATLPDVIIAGMDPTFFVTESEVLCLDCEVRGKSLYISIPFLRVLSTNEFTAIVGHEMGHFIGNDTKWSKRFYPIYRGAIDTTLSLDQSSNNGGLALLAFLSALIFMNVFLASFEKSVNSISRERELQADQLGVKITSRETMATGLVKLYLYQYVWVYTQNKMKEALSAGKQIINASIFFSEVCKVVPKNFMENEIWNCDVSHPTDTHPPLSVRLNSMAINKNEIYLNVMNEISSNKGIDLIDNAENIEIELSNFEHYKLAMTVRKNKSK